MLNWTVLCLARPWGNPAACERKTKRMALWFKEVSHAIDSVVDNAEIVAQSLADKSRRVLIQGGADGRYIETGHLLYTVGGTTYAVLFDADTLTVKGSAVPVVTGVRRVTGGTNGATQLTTSATGTMRARS